MAQNEIRVLSDLSLVGTLNFSTNFADFPASPTPRTMVVVKGVTYIYTELVYNSGYFSWQPIGLKQTSHLHTQGVPSTVWTVTHNFNSPNFAYFVYDTEHNMMFANIEIIDANTARIMLTSAQAGTAVFFSIEYVNAQVVNAASSVTIGTVTLRDASGVLTVNNNPVAMAQAVSDAFASIYTKSQTDGAIVAAVAVESAVRISNNATTLTSANTYTDDKIAIVINDITSSVATNAVDASDYTDAKVAEEMNRATSAESELGTRIDAVISNTDSVALNSLAEVVSAFQAADGGMNAAITALGTNATSAIATEISRATAAEMGLTTALTAETLARTTADSTNASAISTESSTRASAILAETTARSSSISTEIARATAAENVLTTALSSEVAARISADAANLSTAKGYSDTGIFNEVTSRNAAITSETNRATAAEGIIAANLANEVMIRATDITSATANLSADASAKVLVETNARIAANTVTLTSAKSYADGIVATEASTRATNDAATLTSAKSYTDSSIVSEVTARNSAISSGSVASANKLTTARTINGVSFDGTTNVSFGTDAVAEGTTNKYFTTARSSAAAPVQTVFGRTGAIVLTSTDIPALDYSKITTGKPTTLLGYGIIDSLTTTQLNNTFVAKQYKLNPFSVYGSVGTVTLSGANNLSVRSANASIQIAKVTDYKTTGKFVYEAINTTGTAGVFGFGSAYPPNEDTLLGDAGTPNSFGYRPWTGTVYSSNANIIVNSTAGGSIIVAHMWAIDLDAGKAWLCINNVWAGNGNPATGINPTVTFVPGTSFAPAVNVGRFDLANTVTCNFGQTAFVNTVPSGFMPGWGTIVDAGTVTTFNGRNNAITLTSSDVTTALGFTPSNVAIAVTSVAGRTGAVVLTSADVSGVAVQATTYTKVEVDAAIAAAITAFAATLYV